ncbi:MAG: zinc ribbon domain-containing protein, partial [Actinobacteria bacterium]|nr:zinc ribbon domain-containing protein [Actinomycetota bacterium]
MECLICGHENRSQARFCEECRWGLVRRCPRCQEQLRPGGVADLGLADEGVRADGGGPAVGDEQVQRRSSRSWSGLRCAR